MAKSKTSPWLIFGVLMTILVLGGGFLYLGNVEQSAFGSEKETTGDCTNAPKIDLTVFNADDDKQGTEVTSVTTYVIRDGSYIGSKNLSSMEFSYGEDISLLLSKSNYLDEVIEVKDIKCGSNSVIADMYATSTNSFKVKNTDGTAVLTDSASGGANNQSSSTSTMNFAIQIDSTVDESTGDLVIVVETNTTEVDSISLSGLGGASKADVPEFHSDEFSGSSITKAFEVPAILDGTSIDGTLTLDPESGATIGADETPVYVTAYSKQAFVDDDGSFGYGVEDESGDSKAEDNWDYDFLIKA
jgi:hypothetical protein